MKVNRKGNRGEVLGPAMEITDQAEADEFFEDLVSWAMEDGTTRERAIEISKHNIGYYSGYYGIEVQRRVERLFKCTHPIFGSTEGRQKSAQEVFDEGVRRGMEHSR